MRAQPGSGDDAPGSTGREDALVARLSALGPALGGDPDPEWEARTRARLVAMAAVRTPEPAPAGPLRRFASRSEARRGSWRGRLAAALAGVAAVVAALAGVVALSADAGPGDPLYGVKRGTEQARLALAGDERGRTLLRLATTRLDELEDLLADRPPADLVEETLATMDAETLDRVQGWSVEQSVTVERLLSDVPEEARAEATAYAELLARVERRAARLRAALDCAEGTATIRTDELGPVPDPCPSDAPPGASSVPTPGLPPAPTTGGPSVPTTGGPSAPATGVPAGTGTPGPSELPASGAPGPASGTDGAPGTTPGTADSSGAPEPSATAEPAPEAPPASGSAEPSRSEEPSGDGGVTGEAPEPALPTRSAPIRTLPPPSAPTLFRDPEGLARPPAAGSAASPSSAAASAAATAATAEIDPTCAPSAAPDC